MFCFQTALLLYRSFSVELFFFKGAFGETFVEATEGALFTTVRYFNRSPRKALFAVSIVVRIESTVSSKSNSLLNLENLGQ